MSVDATLAVLYAQTGMATSMANAASVAPQASAAMSRMLAAENARLERQQIARSEKGDKTALDANAERRQGRGFGSRRRRRQPPAQEDAAPAGAISPLVGNLLNLSI